MELLNSRGFLIECEVFRETRQKTVSKIKAKEIKETKTGQSARITARHRMFVQNSGVKQSESADLQAFFLGSLHLFSVFISEY